MRPYEEAAVENVAARARETAERDAAAIRIILENTPHAGVDIEYLENRLLTECDVTLNFHPDRYSGNGRLIIENLLGGGQYLCQFATGTSNGGMTAFAGGDRDVWERNMFRGAYHAEGTIFENRPKYGGLNVFNYIDGASARFGSCFFTLKPHMLGRCTFAYGDSSTNPAALGAKDNFHAVFLAILQDTEKTGRMLNQAAFGADKAIAYILSMKKGELIKIGRNLDDCIETHVHGDISLGDDIDGLYLDESFRDTLIREQAESLSGKYDIGIHWIPERKVDYRDVTDGFRGPAVPALAKRAVKVLGIESNRINAAVIGAASRSNLDNPEEWADLGGERELFQYFKQLWHTVAYFG